MASEEYKESEISKIVKRLMDEEGFEFGEAVREAMEQTKNFESKADGGSIGIEVLFTDKMANGGRVPAVSGGFLKLLAEGASKGKKGIMELVESGKGRFDEFVETMNQSKKPSELIDSVDIPKYLIKSDEPMTLAKMNLDRKTIDTIENTYKLGLYDEMPEVIKAKNLLERFTKPVGSVGLGTSDRVIDYKRAEEILNVKLNGDETIDELFEIEFRTRPDKIPDEGLADGGRVGLFMGGDPLTGQALAIYNSMNVTGATDQEIADRLQALGLYTPGGSTTPETGDNIIGSQINQGGGGGGGDGGPQGIASIPGTYQKEVIGVMPDGSPMFSGYKQTEGIGIIDSLKNTAEDLFGFYKKYSPIGMIGKAIQDRKDFKQAQTNKAIEQAAMQRKIREAEEAAAAAALENAKRIGRMPTAPSGDGGGGVQDSGGPTGGYSYDSGGREGFGYGLKDGGLATMFTRRR